MPATPPADLYEQDFYAWTQAQARELRRLNATRPNLPLDLPHLAEEIADLGKEQRNSLRSWTVRMHPASPPAPMLPGPDPRRGWIAEIVDFRDEIARRLTRTLRRDLQRQLPALYDDAVRGLRRKLEAYGEHEAAARLPDTCPYRLDEVLDETGGPRRPLLVHDSLCLNGAA